MSSHPFRDVAIAGSYNTRQARRLPDADPLSLAVEATLGVLEEVGINRLEVDGVAGPLSESVVYQLGIGPAWVSRERTGIRALLDAAAAVATGLCSTVVIMGANAGEYVDRGSTAPWTRPTNEFVASVGLFTAGEFALIARRHMAMYGTTPEHLAAVAATIRNNGHVNPQAVLYGKGPVSEDDVLRSRMVADPFHLLDCSITSEGGAAVVVTSAGRGPDTRRSPVYILGAGIDYMGPPYQYPPAWNVPGRPQKDDAPGWVGRRAARHAFGTAGLGVQDVDVCEFYDPFSFEVIRQFEAFEFCGPGEGGDFVLDGNIAPGGSYPTSTDGGLLSFSHSAGAQGLQRVGRAVSQLQGLCPTGQVHGAEVALATNGGAGALFSEVLLLGRDRP